MTDDAVEMPDDDGPLDIDEFVAFSPTHTFIHTLTGRFWSATAVNARLKPVELLDASGLPVSKKDGTPLTIKATTWLDRNRPVDDVTWAPGEPQLIEGKTVIDGGWVEHPRVVCFNFYRPSRLLLGDKQAAQPWIAHVYKVFEPDDAAHIVKYLAHRVQRPHEKINHALVLGGAQGIGKDTLLEPVKMAVGSWNFHEISPRDMLGGFTPYLKSVVLRINEARDLGDINRYSFYDHLKIYTAAPPDSLRVNEKFQPEYYAFNVMGVVITTNHKTDGVFLPADDRRHYVAWSKRTKADFTEVYWQELWGWYHGDDGFEHVAAYLAELDINGFNPKAPPPKTEAFWDIVSANVSPEDDELGDVLEKMGHPDAVTVAQLTLNATGQVAEWLMDRKNRRSIPHRMERNGYMLVRNPDAPKDGYWALSEGRRPVYGRSELSRAEQLTAVRKLAR